MADRSPRALARRGLLTLILVGAFGIAELSAQEIASAETSEDDTTLERVRTFGDLRLRAEELSLVTGKTFDRQRAFVRAGLIWSATDTLEVGVAFKATAATYPSKIANDNEEREGSRLDQAFIRWLPSFESEVAIGKTELPLALTPLVWDEDLRPIGASFVAGRSARAFDRLELVAGVFALDHRLGDESRLAAVQGAWHIREGAARGGRVRLGLLYFDDLERLVASGLIRTNRNDGARPLSDFELVDLQAAGHVPAGRGLLEGELNLVSNLGADDEDQGYRASVAWRQEGDPGRWEVGATTQRIDRDAVPAAFNSDDWWFHSDMRGESAWIKLRPRRDFSVSAAFFSERLDAHSSDTERFLIDVELRF